MNAKKLFVKSLLILSVYTILFSCSGGQPIRNQQPPTLSVQVLDTINKELFEEYPATLRGKQDIDIRPQISGFVTEVLVDEGALVKKGQILFIIDPVQYEEAVNVAKANVRVAESSVETASLTANNKKELAKQKVISDYDAQVAENNLRQAQSNLAQAKAQLVSAEKNLSYTRITSPTDGIIGKIPFRKGALVSPSTTEAMTTVSEFSSMYAYFSMTEKKLLALSKENISAKDISKSFPKVQLKLADGSIYKSEGKIATISGVIDENTGAVSIRALFSNEKGILRSGGTGSILLPYQLKACISIPQSATYEIQNKVYAYTVDKSNKVHNTAIDVYPINDGKEYIVTNGLQAGDKIVTEGVGTLKDGMQINIKQN